jgi:cyclophilin family peptidyl-prolyl cis-trans isomerase
MMIIVTALLAAALAAAQSAPASPAAPTVSGPVVALETTMGTIRIALDEQKAPITVKNFLAYVRAGHYDGTIFHRVIPRFMIQGGGMDATMKEKPTRAPIKNEAANKLRNERGTVAMARTAEPNSATAQFFVNLKNNASLDYGIGGPGYAVFGTVIEGMDVVDRIAAVTTSSKGGHQDVPRTPVVIAKARVEAARTPSAAPADAVEKPAPASPAPMPQRN